MPKDPFNPLLDKLSEILKFMEKNASHPLPESVDSALIKEVANLEQAVLRFQDSATKEIEKEGKSTSNVYKKFEKTPEIYSDKEQKILARIRNIGVNAVILRAGLIGAVRQQKNSKLREIGKNTKKSIQHRRSKFKGLDGDSKWRRM